MLLAQPVKDQSEKAAWAKHSAGTEIKTAPPTSRRAVCFRACGLGVATRADQLADLEHRVRCVLAVAVGAAGVTAARSLQFDLHMMAVNAAVAGIGVALGLSPMVDDALAEGRLVAPFEMRLPARDAHFVVTPEEAIGRTEAQAFKSWLIQEARTWGKRSK